MRPTLSLLDVYRGDGLDQLMLTDDFVEFKRHGGGGKSLYMYGNFVVSYAHKASDAVWD